MESMSHGQENLNTQKEWGNSPNLTHFCLDTIDFSVYQVTKEKCRVFIYFFLTDEAQVFISSQLAQDSGQARAYLGEVLKTPLV